MMNKCGPAIFCFAVAMGDAFGGELASQASAETQKLPFGLPAPPKAVGKYRPFKKAGNLVYINQIALEEGRVVKPGIIGKDVSLAEAEEATRLAMSYCGKLWIRS